MCKLNGLKIQVTEVEDGYLVEFGAATFVADAEQMSEVVRQYQKIRATRVSEARARARAAFKADEGVVKGYRVLGPEFDYE